MATQTQLQYVSDESGEAVSVIVPIELWREIEAEREDRDLESVALATVKVGTDALEIVGGYSADARRRLGAWHSLEKITTGCEVDDARASIYGERGL